MKIFSKSIRITATSVIIIVLVVLTAITGIWFDNSSDAKTGAILGSLVAGLIVAIIQFIIAWQDYSQTEKLKELELIKVLYNRDDRTFYENYIKKSKRKISLMGVTGSRLFKDFADNSPNATSNAKVLIEALERGVKVKILLPTKDFVEETKIQDIEVVKQQVTIFTAKYPTIFEVRYFEHVPAHSIFKVDDECIVGPVFPELESKYTPALYLQNTSPVADKYLKYFDNEWERTKQ
jgi:hypothetical protein